MLGLAGLAAVVAIWVALDHSNLSSIRRTVTEAWQDTYGAYREREYAMPDLMTLVQITSAQDQASVQAARDAFALIPVPAWTETGLPADVAVYEGKQRDFAAAMERALAILQTDPAVASDVRLRTLRDKFAENTATIAEARAALFQAIANYNAALSSFPTLLWVWAAGDQPVPSPTP